MLVGVDISEYQGQPDWATLKNNANFVIIRSSYGVGYIDKSFGFNRQQARQAGILRGFYHYAYPQYNTPEAEAQWFLDVLNGDPLQAGEVLFLDMEESGFTGDRAAWAKAFLDYVASKLNGYRGLFYSYQDYMNGYNWQPLVDAGYGLWLASYTYDPTVNTGNTQQWPFMAFQQWTDKESVPGLTGVVDGDAFFGDAVAFTKYGFQVPAPIAMQSTEQQISSTPTTQPVSQATEISVPSTPSGNIGQTTPDTTTQTASPAGQIVTPSQSSTVSTQVPVVPITSLSPRPEVQNSHLLIVQVLSALHDFIGYLIKYFNR